MYVSSMISLFSMRLRCAVLKLISCRVRSAPECTDLIIQIARKMASDLSSLVFELLMLSSCMLVGGQNCSLKGTVYPIKVTGLDY